MTESANCACDFFLAPGSVDEIRDFSMDPVFLAAFRVDTDYSRDSSTLFFLVLFRGEMLPKRLLDPALLPLHIHFNIMRVRKLANYLLV